MRIRDDHLLAEAYSQQILNEANLFSDSPVRMFLRIQFTRYRIQDETIKNWLTKSYIAWLRDPKQANDKQFLLKSHEWKEGEPEYAKRSDVVDFTEFNAVHYAYLEGDYRLTWSHLFDYLLQLSSEDKAKLYKQNFLQIIQKTQEWDKHLKKQQELANKPKLEEGKDITTVMSFPDGFRFVRLESKQAYEDEGKLMGHCVAGYYYNRPSVHPYRDEESDLTIIYSLRDPQGYPHVTIERSVDIIMQIKGKENEAPVAKYVPYCQAFIKKLNLPVEEDGAGIGMVSWGGPKQGGFSGYYFWPDSDEWKHVMKTEIIPEQHNRLKDIAAVFQDSETYYKKGVYDGDIRLSGLFFKELPEILKDKFILGNLDVSNNQLTSLKNSPLGVYGDFNCTNNQLTDFTGAPKYIHRRLMAKHNKFTTLNDIPYAAEGVIIGDFNHDYIKDKLEKAYDRIPSDIKHNIPAMAAFVQKI